MRKSRFFLSLLVTVGPAALGVIACGGDAPNPVDTDTIDASTLGDSSVPRPEPDAESDAAPPPSVTAKATATTQYIGHVVEVDGSRSTGPGALAFAWTVTSAPAGSAVSTATLGGAATATASFSPDRIGTYTLTLKVTAGTLAASTNVTAAVLDPPVFYVNDQADASTGDQLISLNVAGATAGDGGTAVSCFTNDAGSYSSFARQTSRAGSDWWEAPAGQASRAVYIVEAPGDGGIRTVLAATTSNANCGTASKILAEAPGPGASFGSHPFEQPRLSPNGARVVYARNDANGARIATVGFDGSAPRLVAPWAALADGGPNPDAGLGFTSVGARPVWLGDANVAWLQYVDVNVWQIVRAADQADASPSLLMTCTGTAPSQFDVLANGEIIVSQVTGTGNAMVTQIQAYPVDPTTKQCGTPRDVSKLTSTIGASRAYDFSLSPDKTQVAFLASDDATGTSNARIARVDGTGEPTAVGTLTSGSRGPRWVGDGAFVTWGLSGVELDPGTGEAVGVATPDGGGAHLAAWSGSGGNASAIGNGFWSCAFSPAIGSGAGFFGAVGLLGLRLVRRRRARS